MIRFVSLKLNLVLIMPINFVLKMSLLVMSATAASNAHHNACIIELNSMDPDQTTPSDLGPNCLQYMLPIYINR